MSIDQNRIKKTYPSIRGRQSFITLGESMAGAVGPAGPSGSIGPQGIQGETGNSGEDGWTTILDIDFSTESAFDFKAQGDGLWTINTADVTIAGTANMTTAEILPGVGLKCTATAIHLIGDIFIEPTGQYAYSVGQGLEVMCVVSTNTIDVLNENITLHLESSIDGYIFSQGRICTSDFPVVNVDWNFNAQTTTDTPSHNLMGIRANGSYGEGGSLIDTGTWPINNPTSPWTTLRGSGLFTHPTVGGAIGARITFGSGPDPGEKVGANRTYTIKKLRIRTLGGQGPAGINGTNGTNGAGAAFLGTGVPVVGPGADATSNTTIYTVPASPTGNGRAIVSGIIGRVKTAFTGDLINMTIGLAAGGQDFLISVNPTNAAEGAIYGLALSFLGDAFNMLDGYNAVLNAGDTIVVSITSVGGATVPIEIDFDIVGWLIGG
jgi:hypothetical protein